MSKKCTPCSMKIPPLFVRLPEPVVLPQAFVARVVLERPAQHVSEQLRIHQRFDLPEERVVPLHQVGHEQTVAYPAPVTRSRRRAPASPPEAFRRSHACRRGGRPAPAHGGGMAGWRCRQAGRPAWASNTSTCSTSSRPNRAAQARDACRCVPAMHRSVAPGTCANCCAANMPKPPKPRMPMPTVSAVMEYGTLSGAE